MVTNPASEIWPSDKFREKQYETLQSVLNAIDNGYKNIIIDAPVGTGKSLIGTALLRYLDNGFYTTPQRSLREQVQNDNLLEPHVEDLRARKDYRCSITGDNCKDCSIYQDQEESCAEHACSYWRRKQSVMASDIAVITFSMMIVDGMIPEHINGKKISFGYRDGIVVDEAHGLVEQTREMHAGFDITPYGLPDQIFNGVTDSVSWEADRFYHVEEELVTIQNRCEEYVRDIPAMEMTPKEQRCKTLAAKIQRARDDVEDDKPWVVDVEGKNYSNSYVKTLELRPIYVGSFLRNFIWNRANTRIISTATLRHRSNPDIWLRSVGLDPEESKVISVGMTFPPENRPVIKNKMVGSMSGGGIDRHWDGVMTELNDICQMHYDHKGICHTSSYDRAEKVENTVTHEDHPYLYNNIYVHQQDDDPKAVIENWQASDNDLLLSPSMMEGIDLDGDKGRYNVLMKVPYPSRTSWTEYMLNETDFGWHDYYDRTAIRVAQSYGRTNRSKDDWSNYFVLDKDYKKLKKKAQLPEWMLEAEGYQPIDARSLFEQ